MSNFTINEIINFCHKNDTRGRCFDEWPDDIMAAYLKFHFNNGSLALVEKGGELVAMGVAVRMMEGDMERHWIADDPEGDSIYLSDIVATSIEGVQACVEEMDARMPGWDRLKVYAIRNGKRRKWNPEVLKRVRDGWGRVSVEGSNGECGGDSTGGNVPGGGMAGKDAPGELRGVGSAPQADDSRSLCEWFQGRLIRGGTGIKGVADSTARRVDDHVRQGAEMMDRFIEQAEAITRAYSEQYFAATDAVAKGTPPSQPSAYESAMAGKQIDVESLPALKIIEAAAKSGTAGSVNVGGKEIPYDFTGVGSLQQQKIDMQGQEESARRMAQVALDIQSEYGPQFAAQQKEQLLATDPDRYAAQEQLGQQMLSELQAGRELTDQQRQNVEHGVRGAQVARGNVFGPANVAQEALAKFDVGEKLRQQRIGNVQSYLQGMPIAAQFGQLQGAQQGAAPFMPQQLQPGLGVNPNAGAQGMQFASQNYGTYVRGMANQSNPWMTGLGFVGGALGGPMLGTVGKSWGNSLVG